MVMYSLDSKIQPKFVYLQTNHVFFVENSDEESDVDSPPVDVGGATKPCGWSYLALSVRIDEGYMSMFPEVTPYSTCVGMYLLLCGYVYRLQV